MNNPEALIDHLSEKTAHLNSMAPSIGSAFQSGVGRAVSFLASKVPVTAKQAPLDSTLPVAQVEIDKFNRYARIVEDPMAALHHVKNGTLLPQDVETLSVVHPAVYNQMKETLMEKLTDKMNKSDAHEIPYKTRIALSMFMGQNLDSTLSPQAIQSSQAAMSPPQQPPQSQATPSKAGMRQMKSVSNDLTRSQATSLRHQNT
jgi:hypothetical protein